MITSNTGFKKIYFLFIITGLVLLLTTFLIPQKASAQAYVPVKDAALIAAFNAFLASVGGGTYIDPTTGTPYIDPTTGNPVEIATEVCATTTEYRWSDKTNFDFMASTTNSLNVYKEGWKFDDFSIPKDGIKEWKLVPFHQYGDVYYTRGNNAPYPENPGTLEIKNASGTITQKGYYTDATNPYFFLPKKNELADAVINDSASLNCLLQELVEWEKLQINMQMHSMVKEYFTDAQTYMLSQQLLNTLAAATIEWSNKDLQRTVWLDGVATTTTGAIYGYPNTAGQAQNEFWGSDDEIRGGALSGNDLGLNPDVDERDYIAKTVAEEVKGGDSFLTLKNAVGWKPLPAGSSAKEAQAHEMRNSPIVITGMIQSSVAQRMVQAADRSQTEWEVHGGVLSDVDCGDDPFCRDWTIKTPGNILGQQLEAASQIGDDALKTADSFGETTGTSSQELSYKLRQNSLRDYDVQQLLTNQQTPQELFNEFEFVLTDYYGIDEGTTNWARNMLVNTWDDTMWGGGAPTKATGLAETLDLIKKEVEGNITP